MKKNVGLPTFRKKSARKKWLRGLLLFSPVMALFCLIMAVYIASYYQRSIPEDIEETSGVVIQATPHKDKNDQQNSLLESTETTSNQKQEEELLSVDDSTDIYITPRMTYTLEIFDARTNQMNSETQPIPNDMYGLNRVELEEYLRQLAKQENAENQEFDRYYQVTVFSRRAFTVRKTITEKKPVYAVFLIAEDGWLTAYTGDRTAIYEKLQIQLGDFPLEQQAMLTQGIYMKTLADYYDFLESYSS